MDLLESLLNLPCQGGNVGLMGAVAEAVGSRLGPEHVLGVIPAALAPREVCVGLGGVDRAGRSSTSTASHLPLSLPPVQPLQTQRSQARAGHKLPLRKPFLQVVHAAACPTAAACLHPLAPATAAGADFGDDCGRDPGG
jgi:hypothetical protein